MMWSKVMTITCHFSFPTKFKSNDLQNQCQMKETYWSFHPVSLPLTIFEFRFLSDIDLLLLPKIC
jgi:hypothetical protein